LRANGPSEVRGYCFECDNHYEGETIPDEWLI